jgi:hypothetical protein
MELIYKLLLCHFIGDYVLQTDYLATTKGNNWWHLIAHCMTYTTAFLLLFGFDYRIVIILISHLIIDSAKARYKKINYMSDQILHIAILGIYLI